MERKRHWYQALEEDYEITFLELWKINQTGISDKSLNNYKNGATPKQENKIKAILTLIQIKHELFQRETLDQYLNGDYPEREKVIPLNSRYLLDVLKKFDKGSRLISTLNDQFKVSSCLEIVEKTEDIVSQETGESTQKIMAYYANSIDSEIDNTSSINDLENLENLIGALAIVATNICPLKGEDQLTTLWVESDQEDWTIQLMLDQKILPYISVMKRITPNDKGQLVAKNGIHLSEFVKSDIKEKEDLLKELHHCINLITMKMAVRLRDGTILKCPDLIENSDNKAFKDHVKELRETLLARKATEKEIFATVKEAILEDLTDLILDYFTNDDKNPKCALELYKLSSSEGHKPYRLKTGRFSKWIIDRLDKINEKEKSLNNVAEDSVKTNENTSKGENDMTQKNKVGEIHINAGTVQMFTQDNRAITVSYKDVLSELIQKLTGENDIEQGLRDSIQAAINEEPEEENAENQKSRWQRIKNGLNTLEDSAKKVVLFDKAYTIAVKAAPWLAGVS